tara:strand:- start:1188 stop:1421 length:234 start_codon:yes stop_codon:yes gene_type:complete
LIGALIILPVGKFKTSYIPPIGILFVINLFGLSNVLYELKFFLMLIFDLSGDIMDDLFMLLPTGALGILAKLIVLLM